MENCWETWQYRQGLRLQLVLLLSNSLLPSVVSLSSPGGQDALFFFIVVSLYVNFPVLSMGAASISAKVAKHCWYGDYMLVLSLCSQIGDT
jgi:hypothetical protein